MAGYLGNVPVPQATQTRDRFVATSGQTTFATSGYTAGYLDVYLNGVKLDTTDFTATNGSDVVLAIGASADDVVEVVAYSTFEVLNQTFSGNTAVTGDLAVTGDVTATDVTLSGGVYLGGTGSANHLDDYEEGTWTPQWKGLSTAGTGSMSYITKYVKVGNLVTCFIGGNNISLSGASGGIAIGGLPFTIGNTSGKTPSGGSAPLFRNFSWTGDYATTHARENTDHVEFWGITNGGNYTQLATSNIGTEIYLTFSYYTD